MRTRGKIFIPAFVLVSTIVAVPVIEAAELNCSQTLVDGTTMPPMDSSQYIIIRPAQTGLPFYQWENDNAYCGEVSMIQAGLNNGQWMSQFNARLVCGATLPKSTSSLSQSGPDGWCSNYNNLPNYNAQLLIEDPDSSVIVSGTSPYANAAVCLANSRLSGTTYPYSTGFQSPNLDITGYHDYMSWVKSEVIAGHQVTLGVLLKYGTDPQYDHEVSVIAIRTTHLDAIYDDNDVLYFDDHGGYTLVRNNLNKGNPAIPYGAGSDSKGCTPYVFGYTFGSLAQARKGASAGSAQAYSIIIPGVNPTYTSTGEDGYLGTKRITGHNYGFSVSGAIDNSRRGPYLLPIQLSIISATYTASAKNPKDPVAGWQYENSMIGTDLYGMSCTNTPPQNWMDPLTLQATVSGLTSGKRYNLYEYDFCDIKLNRFCDVNDINVPLAVPTRNFNHNSSMATHVTPFTATGTGSTYVQTVTRRSTQIVVFRAVPANAP
jgi:hypothetical protein